LLDAGGHRKRLLNKVASKSRVHNFAYTYMYVCILHFEKKGGRITMYMYI
jgi:hypothetical protein